MASPYSSQGALQALEFAKSCLKQKHEIYRIFFYHDGVHNGSALQAPQQDEVNLQAQWSKLQQEYNLDLVTCIAAALKRGVINQEEAKRYHKPASNLSDGFELSGLGQLLDAQINSDQVVTFA